MSEPPRKKARGWSNIIPGADKGWLAFLSDHHFKSFTAEWETAAKRRISMNPLYLELRTENVLLKLLVAILEGGRSPTWMREEVKDLDFRFRYRDELAQMLRGLLIHQCNVEIYISHFVKISMDESDDRKEFRQALQQI